MVPSSDSPRRGPFEKASSRILVVEDELLIRLIASEMLRDSGFEVVEACNADEALILLKSAVEIDLVITDVRMPGSLDGLALHAAIRAVSPSLPVIITSGHLVHTAAIEDGATMFFAKPYSLEAVVGAVQSQLARCR